MIRALIVDDEENSRLTLKNMLSDYCQNVEVVALAASVKEAIALAKTHSPDVVFLDIEMPVENGFKLLEYYTEIPFEVIFTTAYDQYAVKAFRFSAVDYLLKPIDLEELRMAIEKLEERKKTSKKKHFETLQYNINNQLKKIALPTLEGYSFIDIDDIIYCIASNNYTEIHDIKGSKIIVSKTLKEYEDLLTPNFSFFRTNRSHLVNLTYIKEYKKTKKPTIVMSNGAEISLTLARKKDFLERLGRIY